MDYALQLRAHRALMSAPLWLRQALEMTAEPRQWALGIRDITSATDARTSIAAILPIGMAGAAPFTLLHGTYWPEMRLRGSQERWWREQRRGLESEGFPTAASLNPHLSALGLPPVDGVGEQMSLF